MRWRLSQLKMRKAAIKAMKLIKVKYEVLEPVLDFHTAKDNSVLVHPEEDWFPPCPVGGDNKRNLVASGCDFDGDVEGIMQTVISPLIILIIMKAYNQAIDGAIYLL